jgi:hypothetical protein
MHEKGNTFENFDMSFNSSVQITKQGGKEVTKEDRFASAFGEMSPKPLSYIYSLNALLQFVERYSKNAAIEVGLYYNIIASQMSSHEKSFVSACSFHWTVDESLSQLLIAGETKRIEEIKTRFRHFFIFKEY